MLINRLKSFSKIDQILNFKSSVRYSNFKKNSDIIPLKKHDQVVKKFDYMSQNCGINTKELIRVYGADLDNWGDLSYFKGDYINFGFWEHVELSNNEISIENRIKSSKDLYWKVLKDLNIEKTHTVLEAGCGRGMGIIDLLSQMAPKKIIALDMNIEQLKRVENNLREKKISLDIEFLNKNVYNTQLPDKYIDRIYSVEVAQHFDSMICFAKEMRRILKQDGKIIFTTYFLRHQIPYQKLVKVLPHVDYKLDKLHLIDDVHENFYNSGFKKVSCESIGEHVFYGYDRWLKQMQSNLWSQQFYQAYKQGIIDYYIVRAE